MPVIKFAGFQIECQSGANLRKELLKAGAPLYNGAAKVLNCHGNGICGTCTVRVRGSVSWPTRREERRLAWLKGSDQLNLRLACQCVVEGDIAIEKYGGFLGNDKENRVRYSRKSTSAERDLTASR